MPIRTDNCGLYGQRLDIEQALDATNEFAEAAEKSAIRAEIAASSTGDYDAKYQEVLLLHGETLVAEQESRRQAQLAANSALQTASDAQYTAQAKTAVAQLHNEVQGWNASVDSKHTDVQNWVQTVKEDVATSSGNASSSASNATKAEQQANRAQNIVDSFEGTAGVSSINGQRGVVNLSATDVGALPLTGGNVSGVINAGHISGLGNGNEYYNCSFEAKVNGSFYPSYGFHSEGKYAGTLRQISATTFQFVKQDGSLADLNVNALVASGNIVGGIDVVLRKNGRKHLAFQRADGQAIGYVYADDNGDICMSRGIHGGSSTVLGVDGFRVSGNGGQSGAIRANNLQGGGWDSWQTRNAALGVDVTNSGNVATSIWKATEWGATHLACMDVHMSGGDFNNVDVRLVAGNNEFHWGGAGFRTNGVIIENTEQNSRRTKNTTQGSALDIINNIVTPINRASACRTVIDANQVKQHFPEAHHEFKDTTQPSKLKKRTKPSEGIDLVAIVALQMEAIRELTDKVNKLEAQKKE